MLTVHRLKEAPEVPALFVASLLKIGFRACYCSILDECWLSDLRSTKVQDVATCAAPTHPFDPHGP